MKMERRVELCGLFRDTDILNGKRPFFEQKPKKTASNFDEIFKNECKKLKKEGEKDEI
jgi:hypothetical protein